VGGGVVTRSVFSLPLQLLFLYKVYTFFSYTI